MKIVRKKAGLTFDSTTENYAFSFAKAFMERSLFLLPEESPVFDHQLATEQGIEHIEGRRFAVLVEFRERDPQARSKCIAHFGTLCKVCGFDFEKQYGVIGRGFIHVHHHKRQLSDSQGEHKVDPVKDLIPLCPNCHAMAHSKKPMLSIEELRARMNAAKDGVT